MARKLSKPAKVQSPEKRVQEARARAAQQVYDLVGGPRKGPRKRKGPDVERWCRETHDFTKRNGSWKDAGPQHLVGLYIILHTWCYDVEPADVKGRTVLACRSSAERMLRDDFAGDMDAAVEYIKWAWRREKEREIWRREKGVPGNVLRWRHLFTFGAVLTDYRIDVARQAHG